MTDETNVVALPTLEQRKQDRLTELRSNVVEMLNSISQNPPAHVLIIALSPSDEDPTQDELSVASTLPLNNPMDAERVTHIIGVAADAITTSLGNHNTGTATDD